MSWSATFIDDLERMPSDPIFVVHFLEFPAPASGSASSTPGKELKLSSISGYGDVTGMGMAVSVGGSNLRPVDWDYTTGTASVIFHGETSWPITYYVRRGQVARILMGFQGYSLSDFEPIFIGRVNNISGSPPSWVIDFFDATSLLQNRWGQGSVIANGFGLFADAENATTLDVNYTATDTTLNVASHANLNKPAAHAGMVKITPSSGDEFYLTYTGTGSGTLTGVSATGKHGTTAVNAVSGYAVTNVPFLRAGPLAMYERILISDGSGAAATVHPNLLPAAWGYAVAEEFVDIDDIRTQAACIALSSGSYTLEWKVTEIQTAPWRWLFDQLVSNGLVPVVRQGMFSLRAIQDPDLPTVRTGITITDRDIADIRWTAFHPDVSAEYQAVQVKDHLSGVSGSISATYTFPVEYQKLYDLSDQTWPGNSANIRGNVFDRVEYWGTVIPYKLELDCGGLRLAQLCPGDLVKITSDHIRAGLGTEEDDDWGSRNAMVLGVSADFIAGMVSLVLAVIPIGDAQQ